MNIINIPKQLGHRIINDAHYRLQTWNNFITHPKKITMLNNHDYPFTRGVITVEQQYLLEFNIIDYSSDVDENPQPAFLIYINTSVGLCSFVVGVRMKSDYIDAFLECVPGDDEYAIRGCKYLDSVEDETLKNLYILKLLVPILIVMWSSLKAKREILKIESSEVRTFSDTRKNRPNNKSILLKDGIVFSHVYQDVRPYTRHTAAWEVRGHYRHYKNGKVVFIKPHTKGHGDINDKCYDVPI